MREFSLICARRARSHGNSMWVISVGPIAQLYMLGRRPASFGRATRGAPLQLCATWRQVKPGSLRSKHG